MFFDFCKVGEKLKSLMTKHIRTTHLGSPDQVQLPNVSSLDAHFHSTNVRKKSFFFLTLMKKTLSSFPSRYLHFQTKSAAAATTTTTTVTAAAAAYATSALRQLRP